MSTLHQKSKLVYHRAIWLLSKVSCFTSWMTIEDMCYTYSHKVPASCEFNRSQLCTSCHQFPSIYSSHLDNRSSFIDRKVFQDYLPNKQQAVAKRLYVVGPSSDIEPTLAKRSRSADVHMRDIIHGGAPANTKHLYNICTTSAQRLRRWSNIVQKQNKMLHKCFVFTGARVFLFKTS